MNAIARVVVNVSAVSGVFDYQLPAELIDRVQVGCLVTVPFGSQTVQAIILDLISESPIAELKKVADLLDEQPVVTAQQIQLAAWMAGTYYASMADCLQLMIPPGLSQQSDTLFSLSEGNAIPDGLTELQKRLINLFKKRGPLRGRQLDAAIPHQNWRASIKQLLNRKLVQSRPVLPKPVVNRKMVRTAQINCTPQQVATCQGSLGRSGSPAVLRRQAILNLLLDDGIPVNVSWVYAQTGGNLADLYYLEERELVILSETEVWRDPLEGVEVEPDSPPVLTKDQQAAWQQIQPRLIAGIEPCKPILLNGVTGSGKTELYLQAASEMLHQGRQVIILVPEISLTPQTVRRFVSRFPGQVGLIHSRLSTGERYDTWRRARIGQISIIVGPRSALFTPFPNLGMIVIDECHDDTYYQNDFLPIYNAVETALALQQISKLTLTLGSATPSVEMIYRAQNEKWLHILLPNRILAHQDSVRKRLELLHKNPPEHFEKIGKTALSLPLPFVNIIDMREELKSGNRSIFSRLLKKSLAEVLNAGQQAILFLNRRGYSTYIFCRDCGYTATCPRCNLPLASHAVSGQLVCHTCGYTRQPLASCPNCGSSYIREYGTGTQKVEELVKAEFPQATVLRWDADTTRLKGSEGVLLSHFANHRADILIGTQMLAKGLDLPFVTLVGVVLADVGLNFPDYRAPERTFQLLMQVSGRAGRSLLGGRVVLQTFQPWHYAIQKAANHDLHGFYEQELMYRSQLNYPPFSELIRLEYRQLDWAKAKQAADLLKAEVDDWLERNQVQDIESIGPAPAFFERVNSYYRWQLLLRGTDLKRIMTDLKLEGWKIEVNPPHIL